MRPSSVTLCLLGFLLLQTACTLISKRKIYEPYSGRKRASYRAVGPYAMVAAAHPFASEAGLKMMREGGNAADALVAASFAISVLRPQSTGIGGGGFLIYYNKSSEKTEVLDFRERAPIAARKGMYIDDKGKPLDFLYNGVRLPSASLNGHLAVGTPGLVAGLVDFHQSYGSLPLSKILKPAIELAENGFEVYPSLADSIQYRRKVLSVFPGSRKLFLPNGQPLEVGDRLIQKDLATTLRAIAKEGKKGFYGGKVAKLILKEMKDYGIMSQRDLESYKVKWRAAVESTYRGFKIVSMPPPSSGGTHIIQILNMLAQDDLGVLGHNSVAYIHLVSEAMRRAFADRAKYLGDPDFVDIPLQSLLSKPYALLRRSTIKSESASSSTEIGAGNPTPFESESTTHISVVDPWGNAVSSTQTINWSFGSGVLVEGTGVILNNEMDDFSIGNEVPNVFGLRGGNANSVAAKKTMLSSMSPTLVFENIGGKKSLKMILGSPGGPRIITATLQTILNTIDHKMPIEDAVHSLRFHHQWMPDRLEYEKGALEPRQALRLQRFGHAMKRRAWGIGDVQAISREGGVWVGVSDTRSDGAPRGF